MIGQNITISNAHRGLLLMFFVYGFAVASWAPIVPLMKIALGLNDAKLGLILLSLGFGSIVGMPLSGIFINRYGSRKIIIITTAILAIILPLIINAQNSLQLSSLLFIFGTTIGSADVAINAQAVILQEQIGKQIMSTLHGMFSLGGLFGSLGMGLLIKSNLTPTLSAICVMLIVLLVLFTQGHKILSPIYEKKIPKNSFVLPRGPIFILGGFCFIVYLAEGAMLDWSAIFLQFERGFDQTLNGLGYAMFSVAMATMRFTGDSLITRYGVQRVVILGAIVAALGYFLVVIIPSTFVTLVGFSLVGFGLANIVPIIFSLAGKFPNLAPAIAIPAVTTIGYAGFLIGPAVLGTIAEFVSLSGALGLLSVLLIIVAVAFEKYYPKFTLQLEE